MNSVHRNGEAVEVVQNDAGRDCVVDGRLDDHPEKALTDPVALRKQLVALRVPRLHRFALPLAGDWAMIIAAFALARWINHPGAYILCTLFIGTRQHALGVLGHDGAHRLGTPRLWLNNALTQLFIFWPLGTTMSGYKSFHFPHHRFLNTEQDTEMAYRNLGAPEWDVPRTRNGIAWRFFKDLAGLGAFEALRLMVSMRAEKLRHYLGPWLTIAILSGMAIATGNAWIPIMWFAAFFSSFVAVWRLRCWVEHLGTDDTHRISMPPVMAFMVAPHNAWMHWEHHEWPAIPFWNLPRARKLETTTPVLSIWELFRYYGQCPVIKTGQATLDKAGKSLIVGA